MVKDTQAQFDTCVHAAQEKLPAAAPYIDDVKACQGVSTDTTTVATTTVAALRFEPEISNIVALK